VRIETFHIRENNILLQTTQAQPYSKRFSMELVSVTVWLESIGCYKLFCIVINFQDRDFFLIISCQSLLYDKAKPKKAMSRVSEIYAVSRLVSIG